jgi:hypothetical protein
MIVFLFVHVHREPSQQTPSAMGYLLTQSLVRPFLEPFLLVRLKLADCLQ